MHDVTFDFIRPHQVCEVLYLFPFSLSCFLGFLYCKFIFPDFLLKMYIYDCLYMDRDTEQNQHFRLMSLISAQKKKEKKKEKRKKPRK